MKITGRQAMLIAQDIFANLKIADTPITAAQKEVLDTSGKAITNIERDCDKLKKEMDLLTRAKSLVITNLNEVFGTAMYSGYGYTFKHHRETIEKSIRDKNKPTLQKVADRVEIAALKTEHKNMDKFIAEIAKEFK